jgi:hypothetical protein
MVEAAGIEKVSTPMKSGTYGRNRCLKSASWTFASAPADELLPIIRHKADLAPQRSQLL